MRTVRAPPPTECAASSLASRARSVPRETIRARVETVFCARVDSFESARRRLARGRRPLSIHYQIRLGNVFERRAPTTRFRARGDAGESQWAGALKLIVCVC